MAATKKRSNPTNHQTNQNLPDISVGVLLSKERVNRGWSILEASKVTACSQEYIGAFEENGLPASLSLWHARYVFRRYVSKLGLPWEELWNQFMRQKGIIPRKEALSIQRIPSTLPQLSLTLQTVRISLQLLGIASVLLLLSWYVIVTFLPPSITIEWPLPQTLIHDDHVMVVGSASSQSSLWINGEPTLLRSDGTFQKELYLRSGMNIIRIVAKKAHSATTTVERMVYVKPK